jgi:hypothetical protein
MCRNKDKRGQQSKTKIQEPCLEEGRREKSECFVVRCPNLMETMDTDE